MRIIALPLARGKLRPSANNLVVFHHFDLVLPHAGHKELSTPQKLLKGMVNKAMDLWTSFGKAQKGSWKLWTYELGEHMVDQIAFEELALRNVDPSMGPPVPTSTAKEWGRPHSLPKIPFIYPPSLYPTGADHALCAPLAHLRTLLADRGPRHRRGFYFWMLVAPVTFPIALIPIIPNLPLFFCVWRSWSHYRAYRSSRYLSSLLDRGLIEPNPNVELDRLYTSPGLSSRISQSLPPLVLPAKSSEKTSTSGNVAADKKPASATGSGPARSEQILLTRETITPILEMFSLTESTRVDICRAMNQAHARLGKAPQSD